MAAAGETGSIPQFYSGRAVFITGATGFMGKVLVERLLSTCPDISRLFLLMRTKRDLDPEQRLNQFKDLQVFDVIRQSDPCQLDKLCVVPGDITQPGLGISQDSLNAMRQVSIVFHSAATVKFNEDLKKAVEQNLLPVMKLLDICDQLPNMQAFIHVSTAYSNAELPVVEERVYPPPVPLSQLCDLIKKDNPELDTERYISPKPNTYTFTKAMAESAVQQHGNRGYPVAIFRPTIVISAVQHPFPGWIDNTNGVSGIFLTVSKGLLHVFRINSAAVGDMLPVDIAIDTLIAVAWETALDQLPTTRVYNCSIAENPTTWEEFRLALVRNSRVIPQSSVVWYPYFYLIKNRYLYKASEVFLQTVPLYLMEYISRLLRVKKRMNLIIVSHQLRTMNRVLHYFGLREWKFSTENVRKLRARLSPADRKIYNLDPKSICWEEQYLNFLKGVKKFIMKEKDEEHPAAKIHLNRMRVLHYTVFAVVLPLILFRTLVRKKHRQDLLNIATSKISVFNVLCVRAMETLVDIALRTTAWTMKGLALCKANS